MLRCVSPASRRLRACDPDPPFDSAGLQSGPSGCRGGGGGSGRDCPRYGQNLARREDGKNLGPPSQTAAALEKWLAAAVAGVPVVSRRGMWRARLLGLCGGRLR